MNDSFGVDKLKSQNDASCDKLLINDVNTCLFFVKELVKTEMISKISSSQVFHGHIKILPILEGRFHVDDEGISDLLQNGLLVDDRAHTFLEQYSKIELKLLGFGNFLHGKNLAALLFLNFPDTSKSTRANLIKKFKVISISLFKIDGLAFKGR
jgi:hypothetical protein